MGISMFQHYIPEVDTTALLSETYNTIVNTIKAVVGSVRPGADIHEINDAVQSLFSIKLNRKENDGSYMTIGYNGGYGHDADLIIKIRI